MGILNITPDSFSDGGKFLAADKAIQQAKLMVSHGADIIDIGGESTRPGALEVSAEDEIARVVPVIKALNEKVSVPISIDTSKAIVMEKAVEAGASIINDVYALQAKDALQTAKELDVNVCLMHMKGTPRTMQKKPSYKDVVGEIKQFLQRRIDKCDTVGISLDKITIDPGFGFGKTLEHNINLLKNLQDFQDLGAPILAGISRKSMIGAILDDRDTNGRMVGSVVAALIAAKNGASIIRTHDVLETKDALNVWSRINGFNN